MKILKSKFCKIDDEKTIVEISETEPRTWVGDFALKDVEIIFNDDTTIEIKGERIEWNFVMQKTSVEELNDKPHKSCVYYRYETIFDWFNKKKKPYVKSGWHKLEKTTPYHCKMSKWIVVL